MRHSYWLASFFLCVVSRVLEKMLSKHGKPYDEKKLVPAKRLAMSVDDLVSANLISASRGEQILDNAIDAGVSAVRRYRGSCKPSLKNAARNFKKFRLKMPHASCIAFNACKRNSVADSRLIWPQCFEQFECMGCGLIHSEESTRAQLRQSTTKPVSCNKNK